MAGEAAETWGQGQTVGEELGANCRPVGGAGEGAGAVQNLCPEGKGVQHPDCPAGAPLAGRHRGQGPECEQDVLSEDTASAPRCVFSTRCSRAALWVQCSGRPGAARLPPCRSAHSHRRSALIPPCPGAQDKRMNRGQSPVGETALPGPRENIQRCDFIAGSRPWKVWGPEWPQAATPCSRTRW